MVAAEDPFGSFTLYVSFHRPWFSRGFGKTGHQNCIALTTQTALYPRKFFPRSGLRSRVLIHRLRVPFLHRRDRSPTKESFRPPTLVAVQLQATPPTVVCFALWCPDSGGFWSSGSKRHTPDEPARHYPIFPHPFHDLFTSTP